MLSNFNIKKIGSSIKSLFTAHDEIKKYTEELKEQTEDHLHAINENTNEIHSNYEHSLEIESKMNKLAERMEELSMVIGVANAQKTNEIPKLTTVEKEVFLALYSLCEESEYTTYREIARTINLSETLVMNYLTILVEKGVPIIKSYSDDITKLKLSSYFKNIQTKNDILKIHEDISEQIVLNNFIQKNQN